MEKEFTVEDAIKVQDEQLLDWAKVLTPTAYARLLNWARWSNRNAKTYRDIVRGVDMDNFIHNNLIYENKYFEEPI